MIQQELDILWSVVKFARNHTKAFTVQRDEVYDAFNILRRERASADKKDAIIVDLQHKCRTLEHDANGWKSKYQMEKLLRERDRARGVTGRPAGLGECRCGVGLSKEGKWHESYCPAHTS